jgi:phosphoglycerate dehydrogenase-like enzyme
MNDRPRRAWVPTAAMAADPPAGLVVDVWDGVTELPDGLDEVEFYVVPYTFATAPMELMAKMPRLRVAQTLTAGIDAFIPFVPAGVTLCNARGVRDAGTAEHTLALILTMLNGFPEFTRAADRSEWRFATRDGLADKTVLIVGYGSIGAAVERRLAGFECEVLRVARRPREDVSGLDDLPELLPRADVVVILVPGSHATRGLVDAAFLARMRAGALLVNVARGSVVDTDALVAAAASGHVRAALDVTDPEPLPAEHPLWTTPGVFITPHVGGASAAGQPRAERYVRAQLLRYAHGEPLVNVELGPRR